MKGTAYTDIHRFTPIFTGERNAAIVNVYSCTTNGGDVSQTDAEDGGTATKTAKTGPGGVPKGSLTSDYYKVNNIPAKFNNPEWFVGYGAKKQHPVYRTTNAMYGAHPPNVHTMPTSYFPQPQEFTNRQQQGGMYRNHSLNCGSDKSKVPEF